MVAARVAAVAAAVVVVVVVVVVLIAASDLLLPEVTVLCHTAPLHSGHGPHHHMCRQPAAATQHPLTIPTARCSGFDRILQPPPPAIGIHDGAGVEALHACDAISVVTEFMVDVAGVEAWLCVRSDIMPLEC
jgi:hypothetical protein